MPIYSPPVALGTTPTFTVSGDTPDRTINISVTTLNEGLNVLATLIKDLKTAGIIP